MENILDWGVEVILWLQRLSPALDVPFKALTLMGEEYFFLLSLSFFYWCLDRKTGARLTLLILLSYCLGMWAKDVIAQPRPFEYDPRVQQLFDTVGGGMPSVHATLSVVVWGYLALRYRRAWLWVVSVALMILIPLSRLYLGLHFPTDLLGGYLLGSILLAALWILGPIVEPWLAARRLIAQLLIALAVPALLLLAFPSDGEVGLTSVAVLLGASAGLALERQWVGFAVNGTWWQRGLRLALGVAGFLVLRFGLKAVFTGLTPEAFFLFVRYAVIGLWASLGVPWLSVRLRLAPARKESAQRNNAG